MGKLRASQRPAERLAYYRSSVFFVQCKGKTDHQVKEIVTTRLRALGVLLRDVVVKRRVNNDIEMAGTCVDGGDTPISRCIRQSLEQRARWDAALVEANINKTKLRDDAAQRKQLMDTVETLNDKLSQMEPIARTGGLLLKRAMVVKAKYFYIRLTIWRRADQDMKQAYRRWNVYIDAASADEVSEMEGEGFTRDVLDEVRWRNAPASCTHREGNDAAHVITQQCEEDLDFFQEPAYWKGIYSIASRQQSFVRTMLQQTNCNPEDVFK